MKKLLLLPVLLFFASCSTDDSALEMSQENASDDAQYRSAASVTNPTCLDKVDGFITVDLSQGINKPVLVFTASLTGMSANVNYKARIEMESLSDCEDVNSGTGTKVSFNAANATTLPASLATISVNHLSLPAFNCYRWRVVVDGTTSMKGRGPCTTVSQWYEAPLF